MRIRWLTIEDILQRTQGELRGLQTLRVVMVLVLVAFQSAEVSQSFVRIAATPLWVLPALVGPALFAPLGFVLAQARERDVLRDFLARRLRRAWPLLIAAVLVTVLVVGPLTTTRDLRDYASDPQTATYLLNLFGLPQYRLPGVFEFNDLPDIVNPVFWMVPAYLAAVLLIALCPHRFRRWGWGAIAFACICALAASTILGSSQGALSGPLAYAGPMLCAVLCALLGALAQSWAAAVPLDWRVAGAGASIIGGVALIGSWSWSREPIVLALLSVPAAYVAIWVCVRRAHGSDYWLRLQALSAPLMLVAFPVQQATVTLGPRDQNVVLNLALSVVPMLFVAALAAWLLRLRPWAPVVRPYAWNITSEAGSKRSRRPVSFGEVLRKAGFAFGIGLILVAATMMLFALTFFALQRDSGGI